MKPIVVFDLDDTLYPERDFAASGFNAVSQEISSQFGILNAKDVFLKVQEEGFRGHVFDEALVRLGIAPTNIYIQHLIRIYREHKPDIRLHQDAACILNLLQGRVRLAMISDGWKAIQQRKLRALKIESLFSPVVFTFDMGKEWYKPSRRAFDYVADILGGPCELYTYVADNPAKDFVGASAAGWHTVHIIRHDSIHGNRYPIENAADHMLFDLRELLSLISVGSSCEPHSNNE